MEALRRGGPERPGKTSFPSSGNLPELNAGAPEPAAVSRDDNLLAMRARDRVLLYTRGMELDPLTGVELALASLRRAAGDRQPGYPPEHPLDVAGAMRALRAVLAEHGLSPAVEAPDGGRLVSGPPLQRSPMVPAPDTWSPRRRIRRPFLRSGV